MMFTKNCQNSWRLKPRPRVVSKSAMTPTTNSAYPKDARGGGPTFRSGRRILGLSLVIRTVILRVWIILDGQVQGENEKVSVNPG